MKEDYDCPCEKADPQNFLTNEEILNLLENQNNFKFKQEDYLKLYNCIHCGACGTHIERFLLKTKFLRDGNELTGLNSSVEALKVHGTPFVKNKSRVKLPSGIPEQSDTLLYFGCFTTVKTPRYAENIVKYLISQNIEFCIIEKEVCCGYPILCTGEIQTYDDLIEKNKRIFKEKGYKKIITTCPSCYMVFKKHYTELGIDVNYFTEYLSQSREKKKGNLLIQHACPLKYLEFPDIESKIYEIYSKSGYNVLKVPHNCCGGGVGHQLRIDVAEKIALQRMDDFKQIEKNFPSGFITTYCPDAFWIIKVFGRRKKIKYNLRDPCNLLL